MISINGVDFEPYHSVEPRLPKVKEVDHLSSAEKVRKVKEESESFADLLSHRLKRGWQSYSQQKSQRQYEPRQAVYAKDLMSAPVTAVSQEVSVGEARKLLEDYRIRHLPVVNYDQRIVGLISDRDLILRDESKKVEELMSRSLIVAQAKTRLQEMALTMVLQKIHSIPIVDEEYRVIGIVTSDDLLQSVFKNPQVDFWA